MYNNNSMDILLAFYNNELLMFTAFLALLIVISIDKSMVRKRKRLIYTFAFLCMLYTFLSFIDFGIGSELISVNVPLRLFCCTLRHIVKPMMLILITCSMSTGITRKKLYFVPVIISTLLYLINQKNNICFIITDTNQFEQTPLNYVGLAVFLLYFVILAITYLKHPLIKTVKLRLVTCVVLHLCLAASLGELLANRNVLGSATLISFILMHEILTVLQSNEQLKYKDERLEKQKDALMLSQIQPHFIYNTLNAIYYLCLTNSELASETVLHFSEYLRENLIFSVSEKTLVPIEDEIKHTRHYTDIELLRFPKLTIDYDISDSDYMLPPLSIQPLVENAIRHGVRGKVDGIVTIKLYEQNGNHVIMINDNGVGIKKTDSKEKHPNADGFKANSTSNTLGKHTGLGLINVSERLESLCNGHMEIISTEGQGTTILLTVPVV